MKLCIAGTIGSCGYDSVAFAGFVMQILVNIFDNAWCGTANDNVSSPASLIALGVVNVNIIGFVVSVAFECANLDNS